MSQTSFAYNPAMPELPEVDRVRTTLGPRVLGRRVVRVKILRHDIITGQAQSQAMLRGQIVQNIARHGKQLALVAQGGRCVCVHLGMSGSLQHHAADVSPQAILARGHVHVLWQLDDQSHLSFRDPRRFGGLWTFDSLQSLTQTRWQRLGPDALTITPAALLEAATGSRRPIKALLLDQAVVAGLGNIYVDEALFAARIHPLTSAGKLDASACRLLVRCFKAILRKAVASGGSTIRTYTDGLGESGSFQRTLQVYGRAGQPCTTCRHPLQSRPIIGRTTTFCQYCQRG